VKWKLLEHMKSLRQKYKNLLWSIELENILQEKAPKTLENVKELQRQKKAKEAWRLKEKTVKALLGHEAFKDIKRKIEKVYFRRRMYRGEETYVIPPDVIRHLEKSIFLLEKELRHPPEDYPHYIAAWLLKFKGIDIRTAYEFVNKFYYCREWKARSQLNKFAALHVNENGKAVRKRKNVSANFDNKTFMYIIARNLLMNAKKGSFIRKIYDDAKSDYLTKYPGKKGSAHYHGLRIIAKRILSWSFDVYWHQKGRIPRPMHTRDVPLKDDEIEFPPFTGFTLKDYMSPEETIKFYKKVER